VKKVLIAYFSTGGTTEKMAQYIAEGIRFSAQEATIKRVNEIDDTGQVADFDGYIFGSPTFSLEIPRPMDLFLSKIEDSGMNGKLGGAFGPYTHEVAYQHESHAPAKILEKMQHILQTEPFELGPLILQEDMVDKTEGMRACQDYGRVFGEKLAA